MNVQMLGVNFDSREFEYYNLSEVNYIKLIRLRKNAEQIPVYYTAFGRYAPILTLKDLNLALKPHGFKMMDGSTLVNIRRVIKETITAYGKEITFVDSCEVNVSPRSRMK